MRPAPTLVVLAKAPVAGEAKTRLCPQFTPDEAADLAGAALLDTLETVLIASALLASAVPVVALSGDIACASQAGPLRSALAHFRVVPQRGRDLAQRLVAAHLDAGGQGPTLQVGMDTPQAGSDLLVRCADLLDSADAVLGPAEDGGWWVLGLRDARSAGSLASVPMSRPDTHARTRVALRTGGRSVATAPLQRDVDRPADVAAVAALAPGSRFAAIAQRLASEDRKRAIYVDAGAP